MVNEITTSTALSALGVTEWVLHGEPANEEQFNSMFGKVTGVDDNGSGIVSHDPIDFGVTWSEVEAKLAELKADAPMKELRAKRDVLLAETDWWASSDLTMSAERTAYRQDLRDITDTYSSLDDVVWPNIPE